MPGEIFWSLVACIVCFVVLAKRLVFLRERNGLIYWLLFVVMVLSGGYALWWLVAVA